MKKKHKVRYLPTPYRKEVPPMTVKDLESADSLLEAAVVEETLDSSLPKRNAQAIVAADKYRAITGH